jgi:PAS domain S-box-containing protein
MRGRRKRDERSSRLTAIDDRAEQYRSIVESAPLGLHFYELGEDDRLVFKGANPAADVILGVANERFVGKTIEEAFPPLAATEVPERYRSVCRTGKPWRTEQVDYQDEQIRGAYEVHAFQIGPRRMAAAFLDVTERRRTEEALREGEEKYRTLVDNLNVGVFRVEPGPGGRLLFANRALLRIAGYRDLEEINRRPLAEHFVRPRDKAALEDLVLARGLQSGLPLELRRKSGETIWTSCSLTAARDEAGAVRHLDGILEDITEQKRADEAILESEERFRRLAEAAFEGIAITDRGLILDANRRLAEMLGYTLPELVGARAMDFVAPASRELVQSRMLASDDEPYEHLAQRQDGSTFPVEVHARAIPFEGRVARITAIRDVSDRKEVEQRLRVFRDLLDRSSDGILVADLGSGRVLDVNDTTCTMLGLPRAEALALSLSALDRRLEAPQRERLREALRQRGSLLAEVQVRRDDGSRIPVEVNLRRVAEADQEYLVGIARDVSERRQVESLRQSLQRSELMSVMGRLVGGVAHEVRNPLFAISATLDAFEQDFTENPEYEEYARLLRVEVDRLRQLMQDLLDYGRPMPETFAPASLEEVIREAATACRVAAEKTGVRVRFEGAPGLPEIRMSRARLCQVFVNLIKNALDHAPRGSEVRLAASAIRLDGAGVVRCTVEDAGPGFAEEDIPRLFEPFFTRRQGGTGLGLSIVQRVVEEHEGNVSAANRPGGGAVMTVDLPLPKKVPR